MDTSMISIIKAGESREKYLFFMVDILMIVFKENNILK